MASKSKTEGSSVNVVFARSSFHRRIAEAIYTALGDRAPANREQALQDIEAWLDTPNACPEGAGPVETTKINGVNTIGMLADMWAKDAS